MKAVDPQLTPGPNVLGGGVLAEGQPEYLSLPFAQVVLQAPVRYADGSIVSLPVVGVVTRFQLTDEERAALLEGRDLYVRTLTFGHTYQPVQLSVGEPAL
jgi:hypothetical protein